MEEKGWLTSQPYSCPSYGTEPNFYVTNVSVTYRNEILFKVLLIHSNSLQTQVTSKWCCSFKIDQEKW
jgi:hypothetical protein